MALEAARKWAELYFGDDNKEAWKALHSRAVDYYDHAFMIHRAGIDATIGVRDVWIQAHEQLEVKVQVCRLFDHSHASLTSRLSQNIAKVENCDLVIAKLVWSGRFAKDLHALPGGPVAVKATGKTFVTPISTVFMFDVDGKITRIDEFYTKNWWDGVEEEAYRIVR